MVGHHRAGRVSGRELNPRYFYESFDDLDGLVVAVYDRMVDELAGVVFGTADAAGPDPASQVRAVLERSWTSSPTTPAGRACSTWRPSATRR